MMPPPGSRDRSPLAEIVVRAEGPDTEAASPLDRKVEQLLSQLDGSDALQWNERQSLENRLRQSLEPVGRDALPVYERMLRGSRVLTREAACLSEGGTVLGGAAP